MATPSLFLVIASSALFIAIPSKRMPHSSLFLSLLHTPAPVSSFLSSTHTNRLPHSSLFLLLLQLNTFLLLPIPFSADFCPRALHASDSPLIAHPPLALHSVTSFPTPLSSFVSSILAHIIHHKYKAIKLSPIKEIEGFL